MKPRTADILAWVLIYSGTLLASLGLFVRETQALAGATLIVAGLAGTAAGVVLIWLRSRMTGSPDRPDKETR